MFGNSFFILSLFLFGKKSFFIKQDFVVFIKPNTEKRYSRCPQHGGWSRQTYQR